ncbi:hypothetical protein RHGRI_034475 [Rhododendron griersonianum]|uniref:Uncharacterized protein n=1 Tax=Rhododendron griersonianum TaxID=479676 RepID=A0AAV6I0S1_9ERIC|nr:hypothetical protein RHGRI_034475 [Rhododendron griersonianum]
MFNQKTLASTPASLLPNPTMTYGPKSWRCRLQNVRSLNILSVTHPNRRKLMLPMRSGMQKIKKSRDGY